MGCIFFELLTGVTPFNCNSENELIKKVNDGRYIVRTNKKPVYIETCLFLLECLQMQEEDRIEFDNLLITPLISDEFSGTELHELDMASFYSDLMISEQRVESGELHARSFANSLTDVIDGFSSHDKEVILTTKPSFIREILVK